MLTPGKKRFVRHTRIIVTHYGGPDALQVVEEECPEPESGEVRVKALAAGVALPDLMMREGIHPEPPPLPFTPGWDLVGVVDRLGDGVPGIERRAGSLPRCRSAVHMRSLSACRNVNWFRCQLGWTPPRPSASC